MKRNSHVQYKQVVFLCFIELNTFRISFLNSYLARKATFCSHDFVIKLLFAFNRKNGHIANIRPVGITPVAHGGDGRHTMALPNSVVPLRTATDETRCTHRCTSKHTWGSHATRAHLVTKVLVKLIDVARGF